MGKNSRSNPANRGKTTKFLAFFNNFHP